MFHDVTKIVLCGRHNTFATVPEDALHVAWQAQHFGHLRCHFAWLVQHFRRVVLRVFFRIEMSGLRDMVKLTTPHSTLYTPHHTLHSTLYALHPTLSIPVFTLFTLYILHSTLYTQHFTLSTFTLLTLHVHFTLHTLQPTVTLYF